MGSLGRQLKRGRLKKEYQRFAASWRKAKAKQEAEGVQEGAPRLGRRPSFAEWTASLRRVETETKRRQEAEAAAEVPSLDWEDPA